MLNLLLTTILLFACSRLVKKNPQYSDQALSRKDAPAFLLAATPEGSDIDDVEYFKKQTPEALTYEIKYEERDQEVSLTYSEQGQLLEKEEDKKFSTLSLTVQKKIRKHLKAQYQHFTIHETELRTTEDGQKLIDVEVSHPDGPTGFSELSYTMEGKFVSEEPEDMPSIETLN